MKSAWTNWFEMLPTFDGILAAGVRGPDQLSLSKAWADGFPEAALANAWRCVDDAFRVMRLHRFPTRQLRWTYDHAALTAVRRGDGCLLLILTQLELTEPANQTLRSWIDAFLAAADTASRHT
jgi:hypothetical protein